MEKLIFYIMMSINLLSVLGLLLSMLFCFIQVFIIISYLKFYDPEAWMKYHCPDFFYRYTSFWKYVNKEAVNDDKLNNKVKKLKFYNKLVVLFACVAIISMPFALKLKSHLP